MAKSHTHLSIDFQEFDLENGLHVIIHPDPTTPIVVVSVMYHVGSKDERPDRTGFAHFFEHLLFEGSQNIPRGQYDKYVEKAGGTLNANTWFDRTYYYEILPSNQLELGLWLESERMLHAKVEKIGIETQRAVVKEERAQRYDNQPYGTVLEETLKRAYKTHPYRWPVIGDMEHLADADESDFLAFYEKFYVPDNAVLVLAGDVNADEAMPLVQKYFGSIQKNKKIHSDQKNVEPALNEEVRDVIEDHIDLPAVIQAYRIPAMGTADFYALSMVNKILSDGNSSRMHRSIVDENELALAIYNFSLALEDPGLFMTYGIANLGVLPEALEEAMDHEIDKMRHELISEKEFEKIRNQTETDFIQRCRSLEGIAELLASYYTYFHDTDRINTEINRYLSVTREDMREVVNKYIHANNRVVLYYLPKSSHETVAMEE